ncbi:MAG: DUF3387 domain-containing protein [Gemmatimonadota bacterium]|nr:DUF3387 domain-containing protein [Gemmatimonadota bacterium]
MITITKSIVEDAATASRYGCAQIGTTITTPTVPSLRRHGYPPDKQEQATQTVLEQAEALSEGWAG